MSNDVCEKLQYNDRLSQERVRLGLTQTEMAKRGGVAFRTYCDYEAGKTEPKLGFLEAVGRQGADVLYIVTGELSGGHLAPDEMLVLGGYRELDSKGRSGVLGMIAGYNAPEAQPAQKFSMGDVAQIISGGAVNQTGARISTGKRTKG